MLPPNTYKVDDFETIRQTIFDDAYNALSKRFPLENDKYRLVVEDLGYDNIPKYTKLQQKEAIQSDKTLSAKLRGRWVLYDKATGKAVSRSPRKTIMDVPYMTERGTFIRNGTEMTLPIQMRLVPGVYTRVADNGEARAHINVRPGTGSQLSITMNPANPVFKVTQGTRNYKLYPLLKHMGISDEYLISAWGKDIYKANYDDFISGGGWYSAKTAAEENPYNEITKRVFRGELDPLETETALGKPFKTVDPDMMVAAATKLLKVIRGEAEPDNRDSLENQRFFMAPDLISERVRLDAGKVGQTLLWKLSRSGDVNKIPAGALNKYINGLFTESRLAQAIEETNPLDAYMRATKVTRMGEGGISGVDTAPMSARLVQNTYKGFIDPTVSPECCANHLVMSNLGWVEISKVTEDTLIACLIDGKLEYHKPYKVVSYDFNGELYCYNATATAYEVTGNHRMWVCKIGKKAHIHADGGWRNEYKPQYKFEYAEEMHNTNRKLMAGGHRPLSHDIITSYTIGAGDTAITFDIGDWCEFLGWYIAEGYYDHTGNSKSVVAITQDYNVNKENCDLIRNLLTRMGVTFKYKGCDFKIKSRLIRREIAPLGYCYEKFIPEEVFMAPESAQLRFIDAILRGDGRKPKGNENAVLCTTSKRLAEDYERLLFNLGFATSVKFEKDDRESRYLGCYTVRQIVGNELWLRKNGTISSKGKRQYPYFKKPYVGKVYCLSVPGGLFYTKLPGKRPFWIGNSLRAGLDSAITLNSVKGKDGFMYTPMINSISGKREYVNSLVASKSPVAFSEYRNSPQKYIPAMIGNKIEYMPKSQVKYFIPNGDSLFALSSNLIPLKSGIKAGRLLMAQKHQTQAVSLTHRMAPYVQTVHPGDEKISVESSIGKMMGAVFSKGDGKVISVTPDEMTVRYMDGTKETISLYNNHPLNRKTLISNEARVKPGDIVKKGQVLASSNYTDENGVSALGTQLRTAWLPFKGDNYLDAIIVSEDAAKKLTSEHFYHTGVDKDSGTTIGKNAYVAAFPTKFNKDQLATIDKDGLVKPGTMVKFGDPLILSYTKRDATPGSLHRALVKDGVVKWEHEFPGYVTDVVNSSKGVKVYTKAYLPLQTGDKLAARFANKGVTAKVVPTSEMPIAADGKPIDVIFGPTGIVSRVNSAQIVEAMLGKVAAKTGKRYVLPGFMDENMVEFAKRELANAGLTDREDVTDPTTGIVIPQVTVGNSYIVKMHHTAESKGGARATGSYTIDDQPGGSGHDSAKTLGNLVLGALIGHGCFVGSTNILTDRGYMEIGNIVKRRLPVNVYSYNKETDSFEYRPVTNWFVYSVDDSDMWEIHTTARSGIESTKGRGIAGSHRAIHCTKDHKFYTLDRGLVEASKLVEGDTVLTIGDSITDWQKQIIYGTLMGDGYSLRGTLRITHGPKQLSYNEWLYSKLKTFCNSSPIIKEQKSGFGKSVQSRLVTRSVGWISQIANEFYHTNKKTVPSDIITKMGWPGIGIWFADDGSCGNNKGKTHSYNFHTCAFTIQECELLISALNEFTGLIWSLVLKSGKYPVIRLNTRSIKDDQLSKFAKMIAPYLPPGFEYKLGDRYTSDLNYGSFWIDKVPSDHIDKPEICFVKKSAPYIRPDYDTSLVYDITVEHNHNFIAAGVLVSNSTEILKDMKLVKGQKNTDFWRDFKLGRTPVMPSTPLIYEKFLASLQGAGINVHKEKNTTNIFALTNSDINDFAKAEVKNSDTYSSQNMQPMPGGLFDPNIFGPDGTQWGYIKLDEPLLNPIMEDPIKLILGLTEADLEAVISGNKKLPNGLTGGIGLKKQLESINMKQAVQDALNDIKTATKTRRDKAVKKYRYLQSMANHGVSPADFMLDKVPVIPPRFRRITQSGDLTMVADANYLYRALMDNQQDVRDARNIGLPDDIVGSGNLKIYKAFKAITGISDPEDRKLQEKQVSGLLKWVFGKGSPKAGSYQRNVVGGTLDVAGRNVITTNSALRLDEVGLPEKEAWTLYQDFVIRRLVQNGMDPLVATKEVTNRTKLAEDALKQVVNERPVLLTRAPALHKYSIMAFRPRLVKGETIQLSPPIEKPFNADFDGDQQLGRVIVRFKRNIDVPFKYRLDF